MRRVKGEVTAKCEALKSCITAYEVATHARLDTAVLFARARAEAFEHLTQRGEAVIANLQSVCSTLFGLSRIHCSNLKIIPTFHSLILRQAVHQRGTKDFC